MSRNNFVPKNETLLGAKLHQLLPDLKAPPKKKTNSRNLPPLHTIGEDGVDHINIWDQGATDLGKLLAHGTALGFRHSLFNKFATVEGFWNYIRSEEREDRLRKLVGKPLRNCIRELTFRNIVNFRAIIMDANWQKIQQYPVLKEAVKNSTLPFDCYFVYRRADGIAERPGYAFWLLEGFNEIRKALQEDREPNFDFMKDNKKIGIYDGVITPKKEETKTFTKEDQTELATLLRNVSQAPAAEAEAPVAEPEQVWENSDEGCVSAEPLQSSDVVEPEIQ